MKFLVVILYIALGAEGAIPKDWNPYKTVQGDNAGNKTKTKIPGCEACSMTYINHGNRTGYQCHYVDGTAVRTRFGSTEYEYPECVPKQYELTRDIKEYCCFWSPELGCTSLFGDTSPDGFLKSCNRCRDLCDYQQADDNYDDNSARNPNSEHISIILLAPLFLFQLGLSS
ncbi:uncharacterized protein LOC119552945 isoform X2 [Drosophila subpulchrella]|uniref:uncharacterized protein LOC119552945 isoform X2 n=1 Tax=Drosophila subpulchrella TaxID=1486046 RepID=UPI0018A1AA7B|nr:uncharacterized protein LOC119552945 isoform X2 [Drosophila subpulchrella]